MSNQPPSEWTDAAKTVMKELQASKALVEKSDGWEFVMDDEDALVDGHSAMYHITVYKNGKTLASGGGPTVNEAITNVLKRAREKEAQSNGPEED